MSAVSGRHQTKIGENLWERVSAGGAKTYWWTPRLPDPARPGKTKTVWIRLADATNRTEAKDEKDRMIGEERDGKVRVKSDRQWKTVARAFLDDRWRKTTRKERPLAKSTAQVDEDLYRLHLVYFERFGRIDKITKTHIEKFILDKQQELGWSSIKQIRILGRRIHARHIQEFGGLNPWELVDPDVVPKKPRRKRKPIAPRPHEFYPFLAAVDDEDLRFTITLIAFTGMRVSEALGFQREYAYLDEDKLVVAKQLYRGELKDAVKTPAGDDRVVPVVPFLKEEIRIRMEQVEGTFLCVDEDGFSIPDWRVRNHVMKAAESVGRVHTTTHHLRAWFNTTLRRAGVDDDVIKAIVGHESDEDMTDLYTHPYAEEEMIRMVLDTCAEFRFGQIGGEVPVG